MDTDSNSYNDIFPDISKLTEVNPPKPNCRSTSAYISRTVLSDVASRHPTETSSATLNNDDLISSVFEAIRLPDVSYSQDPQRAIKQIDDVLASEDANYHYDESSTIVNVCRRSSSTACNLTVNVSKSDNNTNDVWGRAADSPMQHATEDLNLSENESEHKSGNNGLIKNGKDYEPYYAYSTPKPCLPDHLRECNVERLRSMTVDSSISYSESRIGGFDVHSDNGGFMGEEINLYHDEVAYTRPIQGIIKPSAPIKNVTNEMEEMLKLRQLNDEVAAAQERQRVLTMQVKRERAEIERLRLLKQQNLAREAVAAVLSKLRSSVSDGNWISTDSNSGSLCECSEKMLISPNPYQRSSMESIYEEETVKISLIAENQLKNGNIIGTTDNLDMIMPENEAVKGFSSNHNIRKVIVGGRQAPTNEDKMVLLFGPIGSGKTSTINSMLNYLYDVKKENNFRFVVDYPVKKTTTLTVYVINNTILPFRVTIIDTPGIVDEKDDKAVSTLIKNWFEKELREAGTVRLDAISLVLSHNENSLGWPFINELTSVKHMLGDDLKTNVLPIITNSEVLPQPTAIRSLAQANIGFLEYYKCNNLGFMPNEDRIPKLQHNLFFTHGIASFEAYFRDLEELIHPLLAVLRNGKRSSFLHSPS